MALVLIGSYVKAGPLPAAGAGGAGNTRALGLLLYTEYVYAFEIAAVVLLVAIIAAIALTHRQRRETKHQDPGEQVKVRARDRLRVLNIPVEKRGD
jgi:NADH-quinone oxidoreductase subunit J